MNFGQKPKMTVQTFERREFELKSERNRIMHSMPYEQLLNNSEYWHIADELKQLYADAVNDGLFHDIKAASSWTEKKAKVMAAVKREAIEQYNRQENETDDAIEFP